MDPVEIQTLALNEFLKCLAKVVWQVDREGVADSSLRAQMVRVLRESLPATELGSNEEIAEVAVALTDTLEGYLNWEASDHGNRPLN